MQELKSTSVADEPISDSTEVGQPVDELPRRSDRQRRKNRKKNQENDKNEFFFHHLFLNGTVIIFIILILAIPFFYLQLR